VAKFHLGCLPLSNPISTDGDKAWADNERIQGSIEYQTDFMKEEGKAPVVVRLNAPVNNLKVMHKCEGFTFYRGSHCLTDDEKHVVEVRITAKHIHPPSGGKKKGKAACPSMSHDTIADANDPQFARASSDECVTMQADVFLKLIAGPHTNIKCKYSIDFTGTTG
jgi:hypothetical protein